MLALLVAQQKGLKDRFSRMIIVTYGDIGPKKQIPRELQVHLDANRLLRWNEKNFIKKLRFAINYKL